MFGKTESYLLTGVITGIFVSLFTSVGAMVWRLLFLDSTSTRGPLGELLSLVWGALNFRLIAICTVLSLILLAVDKYASPRAVPALAVAIAVIYTIQYYLGQQGVVGPTGYHVLTVMLISAYLAGGVFYAWLHGRICNAQPDGDGHESPETGEVRTMTRAILVITAIAGIIFIAIWAATLPMTPMMFDSGENLGTWLLFIAWLSVPLWLLIAMSMAYIKFQRHDLAGARRTAMLPLGLLLVVVLFEQLRGLFYAS